MHVWIYDSVPGRFNQVCYRALKGGLGQDICFEAKKKKKTGNLIKQPFVLNKDLPKGLGGLLLMLAMWEEPP